MTPLERLQRGVPTVTAAELAGEAGRGGVRVLVFAGAGERRPETHDVAVIVAELMRIHPGLAVALVDGADEDGLRSRFGVGVVPAVVVTGGDGPAAVLTRVRPWNEYLAALGGALDGARRGAGEAP